MHHRAKDIVQMAVLTLVAEQRVRQHVQVVPAVLVLVKIVLITINLYASHKEAINDMARRTC